MRELKDLLETAGKSTKGRKGALVDRILQEVNLPASVSNTADVGPSYCDAPDTSKLSLTTLLGELRAVGAMSFEIDRAFEDGGIAALHVLLELHHTAACSPRRRKQVGLATVRSPEGAFSRFRP